MSAAPPTQTDSREIHPIQLTPSIRSSIQSSLEAYQDQPHIIQFVHKLLLVSRFISFLDIHEFSASDLAARFDLSEDAVEMLQTHIDNNPFSSVFALPSSLSMASPALRETLRDFGARRFSPDLEPDTRAGVSEALFYPAGVSTPEQLFELFSRAHPNRTTLPAFLAHLRQLFPLLAGTASEFAPACDTCCALRRLGEDDFDAETRNDARRLTAKHLAHQSICRAYFEDAAATARALRALRLWLRGQLITEKATAALLRAPVDVCVAATDESGALTDPWATPYAHAAGGTAGTAGKEGAFPDDVMEEPQRPLLFHGSAPAPGSGVNISVSASCIVKLPHSPHGAAGPFPIHAVAVTNEATRKTFVYIFPAMHGPEPDTVHVITAVEKYLSTHQPAPGEHVLISVDSPAHLRNPLFVNYCALLSCRLSDIQRTTRHKRSRPAKRRREASDSDSDLDASDSLDASEGLLLQAGFPAPAVQLETLLPSTTTALSVSLLLCSGQHAGAAYFQPQAVLARIAATMRTAVVLDGFSVVEVCKSVPGVAQVSLMRNPGNVQGSLSALLFVEGQTRLATLLPNASFVHICPRQALAEKTFQLSVVAAVNVSALPFVPPPDTLPAHAGLPGFLGETLPLKPVGVHTLGPKPDLPLFGVASLPMWTLNVPLSANPMGALLPPEGEWLGYLQGPVLDAFRQIVAEGELDPDTYTWWVLLLARFPVGADTEDVKVPAAATLEAQGPLSAHIAYICMRLLIPSSAELKTATVEMIQTLAKHIERSWHRLQDEGHDAP